MPGIAWVMSSGASYCSSASSAVAGCSATASPASLKSSRNSTARSWTSRLGDIARGSKNLIILLVSNATIDFRGGVQGAFSAPARTAYIFGTA